MWRGAMEEGRRSKKIFTDEHLEPVTRVPLIVTFLYKEGISENQRLRIEYLKEIENIEVLIKNEGLHWTERLITWG